jgi:hypothetical protein
MHGALNALSGVPGLPTIYYGENNDPSGLDREGRDVMDSSRMPR